MVKQNHTIIKHDSLLLRVSIKPYWGSKQKKVKEITGWQLAYR